MGQGPFKLAHYNGAAAVGSNVAVVTVATVPFPLAFKRTCHGLWVNNLDATNALAISFDLGTTSFQVPKSTLLFFDNIIVHQLVITSPIDGHVFDMLSKEG